jgi:hypothetical protein
MMAETDVAVAESSSVETTAAAPQSAVSEDISAPYDYDANEGVEALDLHPAQDSETVVAGDEGEAGVVPAGDVTEVEKPAEGAGEVAAATDQTQLIEDAKALGYAEAFAKRLADAGVLEQVIAEDARLARAETEAEQAAEQPQAPGQPQVAQAQVPQVPAVTPDFEIKLDPAVYGEEFVDTLQKMNQHYAAHISQERGRTQLIERALGIVYKDTRALQEAIKADEIRRFTTWMDGQIEQLGEPYTELFGKGNGEELPMNTPTWQNRVKLANAVRWTQEYGEQRTGKPIDPKVAFRRAVQMEFADHTAKLEKTKIKTELKAQAKGIVARPSARREAVALTEADQARRNKAGRIVIIDQSSQDIRESLP